MSAPDKRDMIRVQGNKEYLPVPQRVQWMRGEHPGWSIDTSVIELNWAEGYAVMRAEVRDDNDHILGSGTKTETRKGFGDFVEKAETGAVGRALARAGYGTEDALDLEGDRYADAPIEQPGRGNGSTGGASPSTRPAPAQYRRDDLIAAMRKHGLDVDATERLATEIGIPFDERPMKPESIDKLIAAIESPEPSVPAGEEEARASSPSEQPAAGGPPSPPAPSPSMDEILAVTGGEEIPPEPGTDAYKALSAPQKAAARAWHATHPKVAA